MSNISQAALLAFDNKSSIESSKQVGCYHCLAIYDSSEVKIYTDGGKTAVCPKCDNDTVLGSNFGEFTEEVLKEANEFWFKKT